MPEPPVSIQDTAFWVAQYRALESQRPDAVFVDPFAEALTGERGARVLAQMTRGRDFAWPMVVRTAVMDEIITRLAPAVDTVVNLAAGLDARPYRLGLPPALRWIEVDFQDMLDYKARILTGTPRCIVERVPLDLADVPARRALLARIGAEAASALVISEGLLVYLSADEVGVLADDLTAQPSFKWWLADIASPFVLRMIQRSMGKTVATGGSAFRFAPDDAPAFFGAHGWRLAEYRANIVEGQRLRREFAYAWLFRLVFPSMWRTESQRERGPMAGVTLLENAKHRL